MLSINHFHNEWKRLHFIGTPLRGFSDRVCSNGHDGLEGGYNVQVVSQLRRSTDGSDGIRTGDSADSKKSKRLCMAGRVCFVGSDVTGSRASGAGKNLASITSLFETGRKDAAGCAPARGQLRRRLRAGNPWKSDRRQPVTDNGEKKTPRIQDPPCRRRKRLCLEKR